MNQCAVCPVFLRLEHSFVPEMSFESDELIYLVRGLALLTCHGVRGAKMPTGAEQKRGHNAPLVATAATLKLMAAWMESRTWLQGESN